MKYIYKVLTPEEWEQATLRGYVHTSLDEIDGFIHLSSSRQLALTLYSYFKKYDKLVLAQIRLESVKDKIVFEESDSEDRGGKFPHLYGKLSIKDICKTWDLERNAFELPLEILIESEKI